MMASMLAPSGSIHGSLPYLNTAANPSEQRPAWEQIARLS